MKEDKILWEKRTDLGVRIWINCRNELYQYFPYMDGAFASLPYQAVSEDKIGTDGNFLYFSPVSLMKQYQRSPEQVCRGYLHILLHCLYGHPWSQEGTLDEGKKRYWNLACDMAVEAVIEKELGIPKHMTEDEIKRSCLDHLRGKNWSAQQIYQKLTDMEFSYEIEEMERAFLFDVHDLWYDSLNREHGQGIRKKWEKIRAYTSQNKDGAQSRAGNLSGVDSEPYKDIASGTYDYRRFLKQFAFPREEVELDHESFDYIYYTLGMEQYGNMPLIEPLEYKEVNRLEELVIAIDTSGSCSRETVQRFLEETFKIFQEKENFFHKMKVYIIQCDCCIQDVAVIHSQEEWKEYGKNIVIQGRSGTDFRPVFRFVKQQQEKKELKNLKALIYFTDGDGIYPEEPDYETAFVFVKQTEGMKMVPSWAIKLRV